MEQDQPNKMFVIIVSIVLSEQSKMRIYLLSIQLMLVYGCLTKMQMGTLIAVLLTLYVMLALTKMVFCIPLRMRIAKICLCRDSRLKQTAATYALR